MTPDEFKQIELALVGMDLVEAKAKAEAAGWFLRVVRDGERRYLGTCDMRPNRVNVAVDDGKVTQVAGIG